MSGAAKQYQKRPPLTLEQRRNSLLPPYFQTVRRIVDAVGDEPVTLDEDLATDLHDAFVNFDIRRSIDERPPDDALKNHLLRIERAARKLVEALGIQDGKELADAHPAVWFALSRRKPDGVEDTSEMVLSARHLYQAAKSFRTDPDPDEKAKLPKFPIEDEREAALQYIITKKLPAIYKKHFGRKFGATIGRKGRPGPGLRFIQAVLTENEISRSPEAIKRRFYSRG